MRHRKMNPIIITVLLAWAGTVSQSQAEELPDQARKALKQAVTYYRTEVASHGGYVYYYSPDLSKRWGEGEATADQVWVQPPGTPTVGVAFLKAYETTGDRYYLDAATKAAETLIYGQLKSGGWTNCIDFDPQGNRTANYRNGKGRGKNNSSLDDGQTQSAIRFLIHADKAHGFQHKAIHESAQIALEALLKAQYPNGAFPQVWTGPVPPQPIVKANYPEYDWRSEGKIKDYWNMYTLNDDLAGSVSKTLIEAHRIYQQDKYLKALTKLGDFLLLAQMPEPQPAWAQQYNYRMHPIWARKFEPPGISGRESQDALETLIRISRSTNQEKYLKPVPQALAYLKKSQLPDGRLARYYALSTNRPLYMSRRGDQYRLTYDDSDLPDHYGWKTESRLDEIEQLYKGMSPSNESMQELSEEHIREIIQSLDEKGRWISTYQGERLVGQPKFRLNQPYISSAVFSENVELLSSYLSELK